MTDDKHLPSPDPDDPAFCGIDQDPVPDHEFHRHGLPPKVKARARARDKLGRFLPGRLGAFACVVPGISLTNYSVNAQGKGWGAPCQQARTTITLDNGVRITVASRIAELTKRILNECLRDGYVIRQADTGAYNCRYISGTKIWSNHAWALAIDINWQLNPMRRPLTTNIPTWMVQKFNRYGFAWGGHYSGTPDAMHFEFMGTPAQADEAWRIFVKEREGTAPGPAPAPSPLPVFAPGSRVLYLKDPHMEGTDVLKLQQVFNKWYYGPNGLPWLGEDGDFGPATDGRVREFQRRAGLTVDGEMGPASWKALGF